MFAITEGKVNFNITHYYTIKGTYFGTLHMVSHIQTHIQEERGGSVVKCRTPPREIVGSRPSRRVVSLSKTHLLLNSTGLPMKRRLCPIITEKLLTET